MHEWSYVCFVIFLIQYLSQFITTFTLLHKYNARRWRKLLWFFTFQNGFIILFLKTYKQHQTVSFHIADPICDLRAYGVLEKYRRKGPSRATADCGNESQLSRHSIERHRDVILMCRCMYRMCLILSVLVSSSTRKLAHNFNAEGYANSAMSLSMGDHRPN